MAGHKAGPTDPLSQDFLSAKDHKAGLSAPDQRKGNKSLFLRTTIDGRLHDESSPYNYAVIPEEGSGRTIFPWGGNTVSVRQTTESIERLERFDITGYFLPSDAASEEHIPAHCLLEYFG